MKEITITNNEAGQRVDRFLKKYLNKANQSFIYKMIRKKNIKLNDNKTEPEEVLKKDDVLQIYLSDETIEKFREKKTLKETKINFKVVYEDDNILVVNKPVGLSTQPDQTSMKSLVDEIKLYLDAKEENISFTFKPSVCNRLDKNTSGIVVAAKNYETLKQTNKAIRERKIKKFYIAKVHGVITEDLELKDYIIKNDDLNMVKIVKHEGENTKQVITNAHPIRNEAKFTWLEIEIETGRAHQIRAHLASIGHPIAGDKKYGRKDSEKYQMLHAYRIVLNGYEGDLSYLNNMEVKCDISEREILSDTGRK
jgi:23S rRNA pseudouridine955/2504/2580 synthase